VCLSLMSGRLGVTVCSLILGILLDYDCIAAVCLLSGTTLGECHDYFIMLFARGFGTQVHGFAPGRSLRIFRTKKILSTPSFGGELKLSVPCRSFTACKISLNVTWKPAFRQNYRNFLTHSSTFRRWVLSRGDTLGDAWWRKLERLTKIAQ
jgi:hypothetical protein